jgi:CubicO group peptidase (beta-lactamase class C family)
VQRLVIFLLIASAWVPRDAAAQTLPPERGRDVPPRALTWTVPGLPDVDIWTVPGPAAAYSLSARTVPRTLTADNVRAFFDAAFAIQRREHALVGEVVSVVHRGDVLFTGGYGWADLEARVPADPERSLFRIASITKPFVWTAVMQLVEQGVLDLDAEIDRYLDFTIPRAYDEPIRLWHLLTHTAGFEETARGWGSRGPEDVGDLGEALEALLPARVRPPGRHAAYSNYGAALAGYIVERVSAQRWVEYTEDHILRPLGMTSTTARTEMPVELRRRHAKGYAYADGMLQPTPYRYLRLGPAGHMSSTARDMASFMLAHLNHGRLGDARILRESTSKRMQSPLFAPYPELPPLLHGFYRSDRNDRVVFGHGGDANQFHSAMLMLPEAELGVFVSFNSDPGALARNVLVAAFLDHFFPTRSPPSERADVDLSDYAGEYVPLRSAYSTFERVRSLFRGLSIHVDGDELVLGNGARLVPTAPDRFEARSGGAPIVFERDDRGAISHMLAGSPLATYGRERGPDAPRNARLLLLTAFSVAVAAVVGWGYRVFRPIPVSRRLPSPHVRVAWVHALLLGGCLLLLPTAIGGIAYGLSPFTRTVLIVFNANLVFGLLTTAFAARQWMTGAGSLGCRCRYAIVALASLVNLWFAWAFNLLGAVL